MDSHQSLISKAEAARRCGFSISTLKRLEISHHFPRRVKITEGRVGFLESEIDDWIASRVEARDVDAYSCERPPRVPPRRRKLRLGVWVDIPILVRRVGKFNPLITGNT